ncbi:MAG: hypothetical protein PUD22_10345 [Erysipelotrichaceae bacterium]|nr:hypothetical protein [Erysipelotrichaceae bacterium]
MINVLIVSNSLIPSVLLCGHSQMEYLKSIKEADYRFLEASKLDDEILTWANIIIFLRSESLIERYASDLAKKAGKHLIYVLDDDLLNIPDYLSSVAYYQRADIKDNIKHIMANCDTFLTPSRIMVNTYGMSFNHAFVIDEPALYPIEEKKDNDIIRIGFAGSIDRAQDINDILSGALRKIKNKYGHSVSIEFIGARPAIVDELGLKHIPYQDSYAVYEEKVKEANWDIGLAPMPLTAFHSCKYFNKYVEYASFGIVGIYSNCSPYTFGIKDGYNGLLVENDTDSWVNAISKLIDDKTLRDNMKANCLKEARDIYSIEVLAMDYFNKIMEGYEPNNARVSGMWKYRFRCFISKVIYKVKEQGFNLPIWAFNKVLKKIRKQ